MGASEALHSLQRALAPSLAHTAEADLAHSCRNSRPDYRALLVVVVIMPKIGACERANLSSLHSANSLSDGWRRFDSAPATNKNQLFTISPNSNLICNGNRPSNLWSRSLDLGSRVM